MVLSFPFIWWPELPMYIRRVPAIPPHDSPTMYSSEMDRNLELK